LNGLYDLVISVWVFQHIPEREGERTFDMLVRGLRPGGVGAIDLVLRPGHPIRQLLRWTTNSLVARENTYRLFRGWVYMLMRSYSLNRIGRLLAAAGVTDWHVHFTPVSDPRSYDNAMVVFRKD